MARDARSGSRTAASTLPAGWLALAGAMVLVYAAPLFWPPGPGFPEPPADAWFLQRLYPGVPPVWIAVRLAALAVAASLLSGAVTAAVQPPFDADEAVPGPAARPALRWAALAVAALHAASAPWASRMGAAAQSAYLITLFVPAALLVAARGRRRGVAPATALAPAMVILAWAAWCLVVDRGSPRVADTVDGWRGFVDTVLFLEQDKSLLTNLLDPDLPGLGSTVLFFHGLPFFQSGLVDLGIPALQAFQVLWVALTAAGVGLLARAIVGPGTAVVAVAVFLFAPYTRFVTLFPGPFLLGPLYATAIALAALAACRRRSEAGLAALGALAGLALAFPGVVPTAVFLGALTAWQLRTTWRTLAIGWLAACASFVAAVLPALSEILDPSRMLQHLLPHGTATLLEPALLGQLPVGAFAQARAAIVPRPLDVIVGALLEPFANPRTPIRLWADAIFDPLGAALMAIGLAACIRSARGSATARFLLVFFGIALCPAFVSPVDRVDIVHAVVLPVPAALVAAAGFAALQRRLAWPRGAGVLTAAVTAAVCAGGIVLFDVVNPRVLSASSIGIMFRALRPETAARVVVLDYPRSFNPDVRWLFTGPMTAYAGERPVGFLEYGGGPLPRDGLTAERKDLIFWSPGLEQDLRVSDAVCAAWPAATLYEIHDPAHLGRVLAARVGHPAWEPALPAGRWRSGACAARTTLP